MSEDADIYASKPIPNWEKSRTGLLELMRRGVVIRYHEKINRTSSAGNVDGNVEYRIDLVTANRSDEPLRKYLWLTFNGVQAIQNGARGLFDFMKFERHEHAPFTDRICVRIDKEWSVWSNEFLRLWQFIGIATTYNRGSFQESCFLFPEDEWVQRQLAMVLGMLFQDGELARQLGIADALGCFIRSANAKRMRSGIRL